MKAEVEAKYKQAGEIAQKAMNYGISLIKPDASIYEICRQVDEYIINEVKSIEDRKGGIAFPCAVSLNEQLCGNSPVSVEVDRKIGKDDLVKIELGVHIDSNPVLMAQSLVLNPQTASETALKLIEASEECTKKIIELIENGLDTVQICASLRDYLKTNYPTFNFGEGIMSHPVGKNNLADYDCNRILLPNPGPEQSKMPFVTQPSKFNSGEVIALDVAISSGSGRLIFPTSSNQKPTIYRCITDKPTNLRLKTSRAVMTDVLKKHGEMAFNLRDMENPVRARLAVQECCQNQVMTAFEILMEKDKGQLTARLQTTVLIQSDGRLLILTKHNN